MEDDDDDDGSSVPGYEYMFSQFFMKNRGKPDEKPVKRKKVANGFNIMLGSWRVLVQA